MNKAQYTRKSSQQKARSTNWIHVLFFVLVCLLIGLGCWQWQRAKEKTSWLAQFEQRQALSPQRLEHLGSEDQWAYRQVTLVGRFDQKRIFHHVNRFYHHQYGYELLIPFQLDSGAWVLVNMGWFPGKKNVNLKKIQFVRQVSGTFLPGQRSKITFKSSQQQWPKTVLFATPSDLSKYASVDFYPLILKSNTPIVEGRRLDITLTTLSPERHRAYAIQWFAFAGIAVVVYGALMRRNRERNE